MEDIVDTLVVYLGLTGFNNVFPATKFDSLSLEIRSGYFLAKSC